MAECFMDSPVGRLRLLERDDALVSIEWTSGGTEEKSPLLEEACSQLDAYFDGRLSVFELPLAPVGSQFQQRIHQAMLEIELGRTKTYGDLAELIDGSAQAVGQACGANPIPIIIPCHRIIGSNGELVGYGGGLQVKKRLLTLEQKQYCFNQISLPF